MTNDPTPDSRTAPREPEGKLTSGAAAARDLSQPAPPIDAVVAAEVEQLGTANAAQVGDRNADGTYTDKKLEEAAEMGAGFSEGHVDPPSAGADLIDRLNERNKRLERTGTDRPPDPSSAARP